MASVISLAPSNPATRLLGDGLLAGALSTAVLAWRGRVEGRSAGAPVNAFTFWFRPSRGLERDDVSRRHAATGLAVHVASSLWWAWLYGRIRARRWRPTPLNAIADAAVVGAVASLVDLTLRRERLEPGFGRRLSRPGVALVYVGFAAGLALGGLFDLRPR